MTDHPLRADWIAARCVGGTLLAWAMQGATVQATATGPIDAPLHDSLLRLVAPWLPGTGRITAVLCGAADGQLVDTPCRPLDLRALPSRSPDQRLALSLMPGLRQTRPPAILRSGAAQIAGFLCLNPGWDGVICLPGARSTWAHVSAGEVVSFQTFLTGALVAQTMAIHSASDTTAIPDWDEEAFARALSDTMTRPERLAAQLASIEAEQVLTALSPTEARARIRGAFIGTELAAARPYWLGQNLAIIGPSQETAPYASALALQGAAATIADGTRMLLAGLTHAHRAIAARA